ncbi:MAG: hypothetical protein NC409_03430 [Clostridium sp.]|nr:hypothetical protein [Clostridium sp.]
MGMESGIARAAMILLAALALGGGLPPQTGNIGNAGGIGQGSGAVGENGAGEESGVGTGANAAGEVINIYEETGMVFDKEREAEAYFMEGLFPACNYDLLGYSVTWSEEARDYGEGRYGQMMWIDCRAGRRREPIEESAAFQNMLDRVGITDTEGIDWDEASVATAIMEQNTGVGEEEANALAKSYMQAYWRLKGMVPLVGEVDFLVVWDEEGSGFTSYLYPGDGGMESPYAYDNSFWESTDGEDAAQGSAMTLRDLNTYLLKRLFIELNDQNAGECRGEYRILDYSVTNRYWTDDVIGTDIVFHVVPKAERVEDLEYFQGILARVWLTDMERIKEILADLEVPGEDEWRSVPHPELAVEEGMIPYTSEPSPRMAAVIEELSGMLTEKGYTSEEADRIANTLMRYYSGCAKWLTEEREYAFCFRTQLNEDGNPVSISINRTGGGSWNTYVPHLKTKEEQQESYFQAGRDEMDGMMHVMF